MHGLFHASRQSHPSDLVVVVAHAQLRVLNGLKMHIVTRLKWGRGRVGGANLAHFGITRGGWGLGGHLFGRRFGR